MTWFAEKIMGHRFPSVSPLLVLSAFILGANGAQAGVRVGIAIDPVRAVAAQKEQNKKKVQKAVAQQKRIQQAVAKQAAANAAAEAHRREMHHKANEARRESAEEAGKREAERRKEHAKDLTDKKP